LAVTNLIVVSSHTHGMAFQSVQKIRRIGSPSSNIAGGGGGKVGYANVGPLKATLPFGLTRSDGSPTGSSSGTLLLLRSGADAQTQANIVKVAKKLYSSPERSEAGSPSYKGRSTLTCC